MIQQKIKNFEKITKEQILTFQNQILNELGLTGLDFVLRKRQIEGIYKFIIDEKDISCFLPTGYGKTLIAILCALSIFTETGKSTIYIGLLKALTSEMRDTFELWFEKIMESPIVLIDDGDHRNVKIEDYENQDWALSCLTPEKFDSMMNNGEKRRIILDKVGLIIHDEIHTIGNIGRGDKMEHYLISVKEHDPSIRHVYLSATVGNPNEFNEWLESDLILAKPEERPVPLKLFIHNYNEIMMSWNDEVPDFHANNQLKLEMLQGLILKRNNSNWIIFVTSRARTEFIAKALCGVRGNITLHEMIRIHGIAYHNAGLKISQKKIVENAFRNGDVKIVVATPTLAVGVNLPADNCVLFDTEQYSSIHGNVVINPNRIQQTIGRAGRPTHICRLCGNEMNVNSCSSCNWENEGNAHILVPNRIRDVVEYRAKNPLIVKSVLKKRLHEKILQWIVSGLANDLVDMIELCSRSYAGITYNDVIEAMDWLVCFGFVNIIIDDEYKITDLGINTVKMYVKPETVVIWQSQICNVKNINDFRELYTRFGFVDEYLENVTVRKEDENILGYSELELGIYFPKPNNHCEKRMCLSCDIKEDCKDKEFLVSDCSDYETNIPEYIPEQLLKAFFLTFYDDLAEKYLPKKKKKVIRNNHTTWIETDQIKHIAISMGDKVTLSKAGKRIFNAAAYIFKKNKPKLSKSLKLLSKMAEAGTLKKELIIIIGLKEIGFSRAMKLVEAGIDTVGKFMELEPVQLAKILNKNASKKLSPRYCKAILEKNHQN